MASGLFQGECKEYFWNVDAHVGPGCPNKMDDVNLVQMGIIVTNKHVTDPTDKAILSAVKLGAPYSGGATDPLTVAIKHIQKKRGGPQDGRVSPAKQVPTLAQASDTWMITVMIRWIRDEMKANWPHLDRWPGCPPALVAASKKVFTEKQL